MERVVRYFTEGKMWIVELEEGVWLKGLFFSVLLCFWRYYG